MGRPKQTGSIALATGLCTVLATARPAAAADPDPWFGRDKALHFGASAAIAGAAYALSTQLFDPIAARAAFSGGIAVSAGAFKECLDAAGLGDPSWKDFTWDVIGMTVGVGIAISLDLATRPAHRTR